MIDLETKELENISGGNQRTGEIFLSAAAGAAQGVSVCMQTGVAIQPVAMLACVGVGAALGVAFPH
ncbi:hypothetical protein CAC02_09655 [Streptococcus gallolyticus]|uniref:Bacteriocin class II with double-glycine leader peptide n=1 Tax=Streptococcus gallolyticus TaxID=315405 RepID=A0A368UBY7_9STRE|nr:Blp family class II bacteriocin [Streptococcus gallolyticus]RCW16228.1 hypothetical protein CAC02_09655 [Streptococcus gallolyticus]